MTERDIELLNFIRKNSEMGTSTLNKLNQEIEHGPLREVIESQLLEYKSVFDGAGRRLTQAGVEAETVSPFMRGMATTMTVAKLVMSDKDTDIADMIITGSTKGVIEITRKIKQYKDVNEDILNLAYRLLVIELVNIDELKHFL